MAGLPIACTLTHEEMAKVQAEYRASQHLYRARATITENAAEIELQGEKGPLGRFLRTMVEREAKCCAFLTFELTETAAGFRLRLGSDAIPPDALSTFVATLFPSAVLEVLNGAGS